MKVCVSGGAGYIGSILVGNLLNKGYHVRVVDNLRYKQTGLLSYCGNPKFEFVFGDVRDNELLKRSIKDCDVILPLAAIVGAPACDADQNLATEVNYYHVKTIVESASKSQTMILPQTNSGYGIGEKDKFCTENSPLNPISHYGKTKCEAERCVLDHGGISLRLATVFGTSPRMRLDLLVNDFTYKALTDGYIVLFEKHFKRNYIHIRDVCKTFMFMIENYDKCRGNVYNVGLSSANLSKFELATKIKQYVPGFSIQCDEIRQDKDKRDYIVSNEKLESLGWKPDYSLDDGIKELIKGFRILFSNQQAFTNL